MVCPALVGGVLDIGTNICVGRKCLHRATGAVVVSLEAMLLAIGLLS